jgi:hypothetical protein
MEQGAVFCTKCGKSADAPHNTALPPHQVNPPPLPKRRAPVGHRERLILSAVVIIPLLVIFLVGWEAVNEANGLGGTLAIMANKGASQSPRPTATPSTLNGYLATHNTPTPQPTLNTGVCGPNRHAEEDTSATPPPPGEDIRVENTPNGPVCLNCPHVYNCVPNNNEVYKQRAKGFAEGFLDTEDTQREWDAKSDADKNAFCHAWLNSSDIVHFAWAVGSPKCKPYVRNEEISSAPFCQRDRKGHLNLTECLPRQ